MPAPDLRPLVCPSTRVARDRRASPLVRPAPSPGRRGPLAAAALALALTLALPDAAAAHIELTSHVTRHGKDRQKSPPCGFPDTTPGAPGDAVYTYEPGETITLAWREFVDHPGHYRVAFDDAGDDDFLDPATADDRYNSDAVLVELDDLADVHEYEVDVTLPAVECEACTIQVIQVMTDKPPFGDGNDLYYHCVDVRLRVGGGPNTTEAAAGGCRCAGDPGAAGGGPLGLAVAVALGLGVIRRRRAA